VIGSLLEDFSVDIIFDILLDIKVSTFAFSQSKENTRVVTQHSMSLEERKPILPCLGAFSIGFPDIFVYGANFYHANSNPQIFSKFKRFNPSYLARS